MISLSLNKCLTDLQWANPLLYSLCFWWNRYSYHGWCCYIVLQYFSSFLSIAQDALEHLLTFGAMLHFSLCHTNLSLFSQVKQHSYSLSPLQASEMGPTLVPCQPWAWEFSCISGSSLEAERLSGLGGFTETVGGPMVLLFFLSYLIFLKGLDPSSFTSVFQSDFLSLLGRSRRTDSASDKGQKAV